MAGNSAILINNYSFLGVLLLSLAAGVVLLVVSKSRRHLLVGAFFCFALAGVMVTHGILGQPQPAVYGAFASLIVLFSLFLGKGGEQDIAGFVLLNGIPPDNVTIYLIDPPTKDNRRSLLSGDNGWFVFPKVQIRGPRVLLRIVIPGKIDRIVEKVCVPNETLQIDLVVQPYDQTPKQPGGTKRRWFIKQ